MTSKKNLFDQNDDQPKRLEDNGPKWGSYVKQNADQSFPYDGKMASERPAEWLKMITERTSWLNRDSKYDYVTGKIYPRKKLNKNPNPTPFDGSPFTNFNSKPSGSGSKPSGSGGSSKPSGSGNSKPSGSGSNSKYPSKK